MIDLMDKKILLVRNDNIGDLICTTPAIEALRKRYPNSQIDIVVNSYNYSAIYKNPFVNKIYCYTKPKHKKSIFNKIKAGVGKLKIFLQIKKENYNVVVIFRSDYSKSAELFSNITNAKYKVGVKNPKGKDNFNIHISVDKNKHEVEFCFDCLKDFGINYNDEKTLYYVSKYYTQKYKKYRNCIVFHISARMKNNQMSSAKIKNIILSLNKYSILITAEPKDHIIADKLSRETNTLFVKTKSLIDYAGLLKNIKLLITLEGGSMHISPAVGTKTLALFGQSQISKWYPWGYRNLVVQDESKIAEKISNTVIIEKVGKCYEF